MSNLTRLAFMACCIADISACSSIVPMDDYITTHNLYGNLCKEMNMEDCEGDKGIAPCPADDDDLKLKEESYVKTNEAKKDPQEGVL